MTTTTEGLDAATISDAINAAEVMVNRSRGAAALLRVLERIRGAAEVSAQVAAAEKRREELAAEIAVLTGDRDAARALLADLRSEQATLRGEIERERRDAAEIHAGEMARNAEALAAAEARLATVRGEVEALLARIGGGAQ